MLDEKKIEEAASTYGASNNCQIIGRNWKMSLKPELKNAFSEGAHWAIQEFLKDLWHSKGEIPNGEILYIDHLDFPHGMEWFRDDHYDEDWLSVIDAEGIKEWIYMKDLLPKQKGGEK